MCLVGGRVVGGPSNVRHEEVGLVALHLTVLNRAAAKRVVKLAGLVRGDAGLVLQNGVVVS